MTLVWPKWLAMGSKRAHFTCLGTPNGVGSFLEKRIFDPFFVAKQPIFKAFCEGPKWLAVGSKWAHFTCLGTPNGLGLPIFDPFWTHFLSHNSPFSRHLGILGGPKRATMSSKRARNICLGIPCGLGSFLKEVIFFLHPVDLVDPFWHPRLWVTSCSLPQPTGPRYGALGVS